MLLLLGFLVGCQEAMNPAPSPSGSQIDDFEAVRARLRQQDVQIATAYREEHAADLPTTVEEVFARHLEAVGGEEAFNSIETLVLRFTAQNSGGSFAEMVRYYKKPLHYRQKMSISERAAVTDGRRVWWVVDDDWELAEGETGYLAVSSMDSHLIDPGAVGIVHEMAGVVAVDGEPGFLVRRIWPHGSEDELFFSANSGILTGMRRESPLTPESWASYWDYRDVGGVKFPFVHIRTIGDAGPPHGLVLQEAQINVPLPDSLFLPPDERSPQE